MKMEPLAVKGDTYFRAGVRIAVGDLKIPNYRAGISTHQSKYTRVSRDLTLDEENI